MRARCERVVARARSVRIAAEWFRRTRARARASEWPARARTRRDRRCGAPHTIPILRREREAPGRAGSPLPAAPRPAWRPGRPSALLRPEPAERARREQSVHEAVERVLERRAPGALVPD